MPVVWVSDSGLVDPLDLVKKSVKTFTEDGLMVASGNCVEVDVKLFADHLGRLS